MTNKNLPLVVLSGRPNVGKSTLFNRLLRRRRSITDPTPGVTRDPVEETAFIAGKPVRLVDTGGFKLDRDDTTDDKTELNDFVKERALEYMQAADLIVLIFEAGELTSEDLELVDLLRPRREKILAVVNKTEGGRKEGEAWNLLSLGFEELIMISAEHGDRIAELEAAIVSRLDFSALETEAATEERSSIALALLGKPNTGKSTLSNRLTSRNASIVSPVPGTTRDVIEGSFSYKNNEFRVLDTAGIRRKAKVSENIEYYSVNRAIKTIDEADIIFLMMDAQEGLTDQDKKIAALVCEKGRGIILVLNKWDLMPDIKNAETAVKDRIRFFFGQMEYAPIVPVSSKDGKGVDELLSTAIRMHAQLCRRTETSALNETLAHWLAENPPPHGPSSRFSVKYAVQLSQRPVRFAFFVSRPAAVTESYKSYLKNKIRKDLGYSMIPVELEIRPSRKPSGKKNDRIHKRRS